MNNYFHIFNILKNRELNELYISIAIRKFALSMISIFVPIYLIVIGYSIKEVLLFLLFVTIIHGLLVIPAAKIATRFGLKHALFFSIPFLIIFYLLLYSLTEYNWPLILLAFFSGVERALFWLAYHTDFAIITNLKNRGRQIGLAKMISLLFIIIGPLVGGLMLVFLNFKTLFVLVSLLLLASVLPLFFSKDSHESLKISLKDTFKKRKLKDALGFFGYGLEKGVTEGIWQIIVFFTILKSYISFGLITSLSLFITLIFIYFIGSFADTNRRKVLRIFAGLNIIVFILRFFTKTALHVFSIDSVNGINKHSINLSFDALSYDKAHKTKVIQFTVFRELMILSGTAVLIILLIPFSDLTISFYIGIFGSLLLFLF